MHLRASLPAAAATLAVAALAPAVADAATPTCAAKPHTVVHNSYGRAWVSGMGLYACTTVYGEKRTVRVGPWRGSTGKVRFDGVTVLWTVPLVRDGRRSDRVWAASAQSGRHWLAGTRLVFATGGQPAREGRVRKLILRDHAAAWITTAGDAVLALDDPQDAPTARGALPTAPVANHQVVLLGTWPGQSATLATTAALDEGDGDGDECGGVNPYTFTVQPAGATASLGVQWTGGWSRPFCG
jgi:hypothetical protein